MSPAPGFDVLSMLRMGSSSDPTAAGSVLDTEQLLAIHIRPSPCLPGHHCGDAHAIQVSSLFILAVPCEHQTYTKGLRIRMR